MLGVGGLGGLPVTNFGLVYLLGFGPYKCMLFDMQCMCHASLMRKVVLGLIILYLSGVKKFLCAQGCHQPFCYL